MTDLADRNSPYLSEFFSESSNPGRLFQIIFGLSVQAISSISMHDVSENKTKLVILESIRCLIHPNVTGSKFLPYIQTMELLQVLARVAQTEDYSAHFIVLSTLFQIVSEYDGATLLRNEDSIELMDTPHETIPQILKTVVVIVFGILGYVIEGFSVNPVVFSCAKQPLTLIKCDLLVKGVLILSAISDTKGLNNAQGTALTSVALNVILKLFSKKEFNQCLPRILPVYKNMLERSKDVAVFQDMLLGLSVSLADAV